VLLLYSIKKTEIFAHIPSDKPTLNKLFIVISSDKGLCGGIHSSVSNLLNALSTTHQIHLWLVLWPMMLPSTPLLRLWSSMTSQKPSSVVLLQLTFNQIGIPTFTDAAGVVDLIMRSGVKYDSVVLVYNKFLNNIVYEAATVEVKGEEVLKESSALN
jgi:F-type H+-transporting ATPase subunit gamma